MTGADKMIETIAQDAKARAEEILAGAREECARILSLAKAQAEEAAEETLAGAKRRAGFDLVTAQSGAAQAEKRALLQLKNEMLRQAVDNALARLRDLPADEYFAVLLKLAAKYAQAGAGELRLSQRDLERLPATFEEQLSAALPKGAQLRVAQKPVELDGGFVLAYGDIEQNCGFAALAAAQMDDIKDRLYAKLFA